MSKFEEEFRPSGITGSELVPLVPQTPEQLHPNDELDFLMKSNGYSRNSSGIWKYEHQSEIVEKLADEFKGQLVSFAGPVTHHMSFSGGGVAAENLLYPFNQKSVTDIIKKYRETDEDQAERLAFLFGSVIRHPFFTLHQSDETKNPREALDFMARMTKLADNKSAEAVASTTAMYIISGGSLDDDRQFVGHMYHMAEAVSEDPIQILQTEDLGLSQVARLRLFVNKLMNGKEQEVLPDISEYKEAFSGFPTVGAEFHLSLKAAEEAPYLWQKLALLNMSQYQRDSYIQLSRNDRDVVEIRMNPSIYPITIANWDHMRLLVPEINQAFFTTTLNRKEGQNDFTWDDDRTLLRNLQALGMLSYATCYENIPSREERAEVDFGSVYLGQTIRVNKGIYSFTGQWTNSKGLNGQFGIYAGLGENFHYLSYFPSMALANPNILQNDKKNVLKRATTLERTLEIPLEERVEFLNNLQNNINNDEKLSAAKEAGDEILKMLTP